MINFRKITEDNFAKIIKMNVLDEAFVASNCYSLAQAWLYREEGDVFPFAIYNVDIPVGFMMLEEDIEAKRLWLWRIMISAEYTGNGYGTSAIQLLFDYVAKAGKYKSIYLNCNRKNTVAMHVYHKLGFTPTEDTYGDDMEMRLDL